jgi:hypothetical protein
MLHGFERESCNICNISAFSLPQQGSQVSSLPLVRTLTPGLVKKCKFPIDAASPRCYTLCDKVPLECLSSLVVLVFLLQALTWHAGEVGFVLGFHPGYQVRNAGKQRTVHSTTQVFEWHI